MELTQTEEQPEVRQTLRSAWIGVAVGAGAAIVFLSGFVAGAFTQRQSGPSAGSDTALRDFLSAYNLVTKQSYYRPLDKRHLVYAAIDGMLSATGDPHTIFLPPQDSQVASQELNGSRFSGIGAIVEPASGALQVDEPLPNTPASRAGMQAGDLITRIDGRPVAGMTSDGAIAKIHGRSGSVVRLTLVRKHGRPFQVSVERAQIPPITAYGRLIGGKWGYLRILSFGDSTAHEVSQTLHLLRAGGARAIILDLRENPGGFVDAAQQVVSQFVKSGVVAYEQDSQHHLQPLAVVPRSQVVSLPVAILVDSGTASAAEITAGALRDDAGAVLIGTRTYGKGSMQSVYPLSDGSTVRITDRLWLTPHKESIQKLGLKPDVPVVPSAQDTVTGRDVELRAAERYLAHHVTR